MGMDLNVYRLIKPLPVLGGDPASDIRSRTIFVTAEQADALRAQFPEANFEHQQFVDMDVLYQVTGVPANWYVSEWELSGATGWVDFEHDGQVSRREIADTAILLRDDPLLSCEFEVEELGYMRKPFRHHTTPVRVEGNTVILSTDNFAGVDRDKVAALMGPHAADASIATFLAADVARLQALAEHCAEPQRWEQVVLDTMGSPDVVTVIDW